uniref:CIA30 domain-containing protein n=1 Tax=Globodera pallida TaxID=36090 RepID=A0A183C488_GLOPA
MVAKDGDKIGQIGVNIMSCSKLGNQIRSNTWTIEEPNSGEFYKFFIGHFSPDPKSRLFLRVRFDGKLPELADPDAFYSVLLKKPNTEINQIDQKKIDQVNESDQSIFAQISVNGKDAAARDEWTGDKGLMLKLNEEGIKYLRENKMPAMELQLTEVGRDDDADSFQDNYRELRELERATLSEELTTNSGGLSPFIFVTRQNSKSLKTNGKAGRPELAIQLPNIITKGEAGRLLLLTMTALVSATVVA